MIKVLQIGMCERGGVETFVFNHYTNINRNQFTFDFTKIMQHIAYEEEIKTLGGKIYPIQGKNPLTYYSQLQYLINENKYDVVHIHISHFINPIPLLAVASSNCKHIILHAHNNGVTTGNIKTTCHNINRVITSKMKVERLACSKSAGKWMFGNAPFSVFENAISISKFQYNEKVRKETRCLFGIGEKDFVIGTVGRFDPQKNQSFLIEIFSQYLKMNPNAYLMIVGDGSLKEELQSLVYKLNIESKVIFAGFCKEVSPFYQAMDVFCLPSLYEGLGIVGIEAQASGLRCIFSNRCVEEVDVSQQSIFLPLENKDAWLHNIHMQYLSRILYSRNTQISGYDIEENVKKLEKIYSRVH